MHQLWPRTIAIKVRQIGNALSSDLCVEKATNNDSVKLRLTQLRSKRWWELPFSRQALSFEMISELRNSHLTRSVIPRSWYAEFRYEGFYCSLDLNMSNVFKATEYSSDKTSRKRWTNQTGTVSAQYGCDGD